LFIALILADSEKPTIFSGDMSLINGNSDDNAIEAAKAVFPLPEGPKRKVYMQHEKHLEHHLIYD